MYSKVTIMGVRNSFTNTPTSPAYNNMEEKQWKLVFQV